ncbi:precorrin-6A synthase (deacetylating) [Corynebacterium sp. sy039]|uniref:precorrin-6A synthase (deacetylating) n=1 Tax=Corynebacterium sp. sy039 TaxID=2599641 RepID=UPI0011B5EFFD|nr:precorrin-6A synthase (deacetylating) [Corynebacterium sp. sy039]QDZ42208.1 precorrin-6A synthase (deacetylating) [Corynebacterium sp. sy039]
MRTIHVIGIGVGSIEMLTLDAIEHLRQCDIVIALDKGEAKADLLALRRNIVDKFAPEIDIISVLDPERDRNPQDYTAEVKKWHEMRAQKLAEAIVQHSAATATIGFLVWGDPALYDSTLRIIDTMKRDCGLEAQVVVVPGITAFQALTAAHAIPLNRIGEPIVISTARKLATLSAQDRSNCVVMLDGAHAWLDSYTHHTYIWWGAYLGSKQQIIREGYVHEIGQELAQLKAQLRREHGWIMDTYLLRELSC